MPHKGASTGTIGNKICSILVAHTSDERAPNDALSRSASLASKSNELDGRLGSGMSVVTISVHHHHDHCAFDQERNFARQLLRSGNFGLLEELLAYLASRIVSACRRAMVRAG